MNFAIFGVNFENKGAELMLHAVRQQIARWGAGHRLCAQVLIGTAAQRQALRLGHLATAVWRTKDRYPGAGKLLNFSASLLPAGLRRSRDIFTEAEIDVLLDASGFAFSDQWGAAKSRRMAQLCALWHAQGKKIILLPQALGPFADAEVRAAFADIVAASDLLFARDTESLDHARQVVGDSPKLRLAPDFTNLLVGQLPANAEKLAGRACVIPNQRMLDMTAGAVAADYLEFLARTLQRLQVAGERPYILVHEVHDKSLAEALRQKIGGVAEVVVESDPLALKGLLGTASLVVSSRFHGLVSALSQGVVSLATGWSHKYRMLFTDYGCPELVLRLEDGLAANLGTIERVLDPATRADYGALIQKHAAAQKILSQKMWTEVAAEIGLASTQPEPSDHALVA